MAFAAGLRPRLAVAIISNSADGARREETARYAFDTIFDPIIYSHEVGLAKPDPAIFELACARLNLAPAQTIFVDDVPGHVAAARALGVHAIVHVSAAETIAAVNAIVSGLISGLRNPRAASAVQLVMRRASGAPGVVIALLSGLALAAAGCGRAPGAPAGQTAPAQQHRSASASASPSPSLSSAARPPGLRLRARRRPQARAERGAVRVGHAGLGRRFRPDPAHRGRRPPLDDPVPDQPTGSAGDRRLHRRQARLGRRCVHAARHHRRRRALARAACAALPANQDRALRQPPGRVRGGGRSPADRRGSHRSAVGRRAAAHHRWRQALAAAAHAARRPDGLLQRSLARLAGSRREHLRLGELGSELDARRPDAERARPARDGRGRVRRPGRRLGRGQWPGRRARPHGADRLPHQRDDVAANLRRAVHGQSQPPQAGAARCLLGPIPARSAPSARPRRPISAGARRARLPGARGCLAPRPWTSRCVAALC